MLFSVFWGEILCNERVLRNEEKLLGISKIQRLVEIVC